MSENVKKILIKILKILFLIGIIVGLGIFLSEIYYHYQDEKYRASIESEKIKILAQINESARILSPNISEFNCDRIYCSEDIELQLSFENISEKNILGIKGNFKLVDTFGKAYEIQSDPRGRYRSEYLFQIEGEFLPQGTIQYKTKVDLRANNKIVYENIQVKSLNITDIVFSDGEILKLR